MGTPVSHYIKTVGNIILSKYNHALSPDFEANKDLVNRVIGYEQTLISIGPTYNPEIQYSLKGLRNKIAGYITCEYNKLQKEKNFPGYSSSGRHSHPKSFKKTWKCNKPRQKPKQPLRLESLLTSRQQYP
jgi:ribosomal protein S17E